MANIAGYRAVIDPEHPLDDVFQVGWNRQWTRPAAVGAALVFIVFDLRSERRLKGCRRARQENAAAGCAGLDHHQAMCLCERFDFRQVGRIGAIGRSILFLGQVIALFR